MATPIYVSDDKWRDGIKFLRGLGTNPTLSKGEQRKLQTLFRGPFANGVPTDSSAETLLRVEMGWEKQSKRA